MSSPLRPDLSVAIAAARNAEFVTRRDMPDLAPRPSRRERRNKPKSAGAGPMRLCYLMPRTDVGGGARVLFEHANRLLDRGHEVTVLSHYQPPRWYDLRTPFVRVPFGVDLAEAVPACDMIVAGYWDQIMAARALGIAPVAHFEQGYFHLFEEIEPPTHAIVARHLEAADLTLTVSGTVADVIRDRYGVASKVVGNAVDPSVFHPAVPGPSGGTPYVLFVGWDGKDFKGMAEMRQVWAALSAERPELALVWVTPKPPLEPLEPRCRVVVAPDQALLGELYRNAAVYVCCSHYESFSLPCLEAMASGTPVVSTRNTGVGEYARDGDNALLADVRDAEGLLTRLRRVLDEPRLAARLRDGGLLTAAGYSWDTIITRIESAYRAIRTAWAPPQPGDWHFDLSGLHLPEASFELRLRERAAATAAGAIAVPVAFPAFGGHRAVRWRIVGRRSGGTGVARAYLPAHADALPSGMPHAAALRDLAEGRIDAALEGFLAVYRGGDHAVRPSISRWIVLTLLELGLGEQAAAVAASGVETYPGNSDFHYLRALAGLRSGQEVDGAAYVTAVETLGPATHADEWFEAPDALIRERLLADATPRTVAGP
ncbi:glycosyltransferase family 4 protein [Dactylosporangium sp. NPDC005555]|uniref:glycosyltransferase family 4 protein n=1 Tax=Dactylosporangium sp. NPDC005555 TaxID=3154889 RepID=UPI0033A81D04